MRLWFMYMNHRTSFNIFLQGIGELPILAFFTFNLWTILNNFLLKWFHNTIGIAIKIRSGQPRNQGSIPIIWKRAFFSTGCPYLLLDKPSLISKRYRGLFPRGQRSRGVKLTIHFHLLSRIRTDEVTPSFPHTSSWLRNALPPQTAETNLKLLGRFYEYLKIYFFTKICHVQHNTR
jgi:hypothetical protein